jgi:hypothetical protein
VEQVRVGVRFINNYDRNSNIHAWSSHKVRKDGARSSHDVHRHNEIAHATVLDQGHASHSGMVNSHSCFMEAWGYPLGQRDRTGQKIGIWKPVNRCIKFLTHGDRTLWKSWSHVSKKSAAEAAHSIHAFNKRKSPHPIIGSEIRPAAIYTRKFAKNLN